MDEHSLEVVRKALTAEQREWHEIRDGKIAAGLVPTAHDVTSEQRRRQAERGEQSPADLFLLAVEVMES